MVRKGGDEKRDRREKQKKEKGLAKMSRGYSATHCNVLQHTATLLHLLMDQLLYRSKFPMCVAVWVCCSVLQCVAVRCGVLRCIPYTSGRYLMFEHTFSLRNCSIDQKSFYVLQCVCLAACCSALQCVALHFVHT